MSVTAAQFFAETDTLPLADLSELIGDGGALIIAPHPDDESLGCGGLLAACAQVGIPSRVVVVSDGAASHPNSALYPHDALRDLREGETRTACIALGQPQEPLFLRLADGAVPLSGDRFEAAVESVVATAKELAASTVFVTWRNDPHRDHKASARLASLAAQRLSGVRLWEYAVWGHTLPPDMLLEEAPRGVRFEITNFLDRKAEAIAAHRSQTTRLIEDDPDGFMLSADMIARFLRPFEIYLGPE